MKTIDFSLMLDSDSVDEIVNSGATVKIMCLQNIATSIRSTNERGDVLEVSRQYGNVINKMKKCGEVVELEDDEFDFILEGLKGAKQIPNAIWPQLVDYFEGVKNTK